MTIESLAEDGRGVARVNGKTVFVAGALAGEQVEASYSNTHKRFDEANIVKVLEPSGDRVEPVCPYFTQCGGCDLQHLDHQAQQDYKQRILQQKFSAIAAECQFAPSLLGEPLAYRHRVRMAIKSDRQQFKLGFRQSDSHQIVDIDHCPVVRPAINKIIPVLKEVLAGLKNRSLLLELSISEGDDSRLGVLLLSKHRLCDEDVEKLKQIADRFLLLLELYSMDGKERALQLQYGEAGLSYCLNDRQLNLTFSLRDFTQVNPQINQALVDTASLWLELSELDHLADYFCGIGNFTLPLAATAGSVTGYELVKEMVVKARDNASRNRVSNTSFHVKDLMTENVKVTKDCNKVLLDPPRAGAEALCRQLVRSPAEKILYISCNPNTLYRDAAILVGGGYSLARMALADMFPQTKHSEVVALFVASGNKNKNKNKSADKTA